MNQKPLFHYVPLFSYQRHGLDSSMIRLVICHIATACKTSLCYFDLQIVDEYFTFYHPPPNVKLDSEHVEALNEFSNR